MTTQIRMYNQEDYPELLSFYERIDSQYFPRLSERPGGLDAHMLKVLNKGGGFFLYLVGNRIEGASAYNPVDKDKSCVEFTLFSFSESFWNSLAPLRLARYMIEMKDPLGYAEVEKFIARTFYPESSARLERLGFNKVAEVENDVIEGRTSYYYEADAKTVVKKLSRK